MQTSMQGRTNIMSSIAYRFRLKPTTKQTRSLDQWIGTCRFLYNLGLEERIVAWENSKQAVNYYEQANQLKGLKQVDGFEWIGNIPSQALQQVLKDLDQAYKNFFRHGGFPKFKKRGERDSFRLPQGFKVDGNTVKLPKIGKIKFIDSRDIEGRIRNVTVSKDGNHWYISFNCEKEIEVPENNGVEIGIDRGVAKTIQTSEDGVFNTPSIETLKQRLKHYQRKLSRLKKGSNRFRKLKLKIAKIWRKIRNVRTDFLHKVSTRLAKNHGKIVLENLKTKNMTKSAKGTLETPGKNVKAKSGLNRSILAQGWYQFEMMLKYKTLWYGSELVFVDPKYTSQRCSGCGHVSKENRKTQSEFECVSCGHRENADLNASKNIKTDGLSVLAQRAEPLGFAVT